MLIVDPTFVTATAVDRNVSLKAIDWKREPIALFGNSKPNGKELLDGVRDKLAAFRSVANIDYVFKKGASQVAPADLIEAVAARYRGALLAIAD